MNTQTLVLNFGRCSWGRCIFCGYGRIIGKEGLKEKVDEKLDEFIENLPEDTDMVKIFGSGSFFDDKQYPEDSRKRFVEKLMGKNVKSIVVESRPEYVNEKNLGLFKEIDFTIAFGLESGVPELLKSVCKGFSLEDFEKASKKVKDAGGKIRGYLLVNIPGDKDISKNLDISVGYSLKFCDSIVLINLLPHGNTPLFKMWINGEWSFLSKSEFREITDPYKDNPRIEFDEETFRFTPTFPSQMKKPLKGVGETYLTHPYFEAWFDYLTRFYQPLNGRSILFLPCSYSKPYSNSRTHKAITKILFDTKSRRFVHEVMISNAGIIPREFEDKYPFNAYDWDEKLETPEIKKRYIQVTTERISDYLKVHLKDYSAVFCYLKYSSESYQALKISSHEMGFELRNLLNEETEKSNPNIKLYDEPALRDLSENTKWLLQNSMQ